ncbi:MAG TPA: 3'(2'),5'-bisphosphate nucleotidase CysQ [Longimicrobiaceae bacterium]|nr:3'(2'),5'-bisphosphate nucleotidase CysQ [Longimicrobiaceae bacterium]
MTDAAGLRADLELAIHAARAAGKEVMRFFRRDAEVRYKGPEQPVTDADLAADRVLHRVLLDERPEYGWLSEETADSPGRLERRRVWVVDPIDGTNSFIRGIAEFALSVGLVEGDRVVLGVVYNPASGEMYHAIAGGGAFRDGTPIRVSPHGSLDDRRLVLASRSEIRRGEFDPFHQGWTVHPLGSTAYKMVKVADRTGDVFLSRGSKSEWDVCGADVIVSEAGGRVTDARGEALRYNQPRPLVRGVIASNGILHKRVIARVAEIASPVGGSGE